MQQVLRPDDPALLKGRLSARTLQRPPGQVCQLQQVAGLPPPDAQIVIGHAGMPGERVAHVPVGPDPAEHDPPTLIEPDPGKHSADPQACVVNGAHRTGHTLTPPLAGRRLSVFQVQTGDAGPDGFQGQQVGVADLAQTAQQGGQPGVLRCDRLHGITLP